MVTVRLGKQLATDYAALVDLFPAAAFKSPRRSTVPLLDYWREPELRLQELGDATGLNLLPSAELSFEHAVPVQKGRGKASFTDLHILTPDAAVALESKYTEPAYECVGDWLGTPIKDNRKLVLEGWLELIVKNTAGKLAYQDVLKLPYQLIHRTASACFLDRPIRAVVYLSFGEGSAAVYEDHIRTLEELLGRKLGLQFHLLDCRLKKLPAFVELEEKWRRQEPDISESVRTALKAGPVFSFDKLSAHQHSDDHLRADLEILGTL